MDCFSIKLYDNLRIILILFIVAIHVLDFSPIASYDSVFYFKESLLRSIVPVFFLISGFFFFQNIKEFSCNIYLNKLFSRIKTLLLPYLIWNIVAFFFCVFTHSTIQMGLDSNYFVFLDLKKIINCLWDLSGGMPVYYPFWFIKYLMIIIIPTPIYYYLIKQFDVLFPIFLLATYLLGILFVGFCPVIIFYIFCFCLGAYYGLCPLRSIIVYKHTYTLLFLWIITSFLDLFFKTSNYYIIIHGINMAIGMIAIISIASKFYQCNNKVWFPSLKKYTFIIYALHAIFIPSLYMMFENITQTKNGFVVVVNIVCVYIFTLAICILIGYILNKFLHKMYLISIGSR